jgi:hypothetical protein
MQRREALRLLASAAAFPLLSREAFALFQDAHEQLPQTAALRILNPQQNAIVATMGELIIPQTDTPGAKAARVNEFIDLILADWCTNEERSRFLAGLSEVDACSRTQFGADFTACSEKQQTKIVAALDKDLHEATKIPPGREINVSEPPAHNFFAMMKHLTLVGYYTSQIGFEQDLHWEIIPSAHAGCKPLAEPAK